MWRYQTPINPAFSIAVDYKPNFGPAPNIAPSAGGQEASWGVTEWDQDYWAEGSADHQFTEKWTPVSGHGKTIAVQVQLTSAGPQKLGCELVSVDLTYSTGQVLV